MKIKIPNLASEIHRDLIEDDKAEFCKSVSQYLKNGSLALLIGAGVSQGGLGFPGWKEMCLKCRELAKDDVAFDDEDSKSTDLPSLIDPIEELPTYKSILHRALYSETPDIDDPKALQFKPVLIGIGAMLTGGATRGRVSAVINYNFDNILERFLTLHGYTSFILTDPNQLESSSETLIYHPHGYIPIDYNESTQTGEIVFSRRSYIARRSESDRNTWKSRLTAQLVSKMGLMIGLSGNDDIVTESIAAAKQHTSNIGRTTAYAILTPDAYDRNQSLLSSFGVVCLSAEKDEIPHILLEICAKAAE